MSHNPLIVTLKIELPEGYYDDDDDLTQDGRATIIDVCDEADFKLISIEQ